jgi:GNAT superfamily N-acetyltransferase
VSGGSVGLSGEAFEVGTAHVAELSALPDLERRAASLFPAGVLPEGVENNALPLAVTRPAQAAGRLFVARRVRSGEVVGFALVGEVDGEGHLEELDVDPEWGRRGIGRRLVEHACAWAKSQGYAQITLSTFRAVPWNAPFYARLGFVETEPSSLGPEVARRRAHEARSGFDLSERCLMVRVIASD